MPQSLVDLVVQQNRTANLFGTIFTATDWSWEWFFVNTPGAHEGMSAHGMT